MKNLTTDQLARLDAATAQVDAMVEKRPLRIAGETDLLRIIHAFDAAITLLEAGQTICVSITDERGSMVAAAPLVLEPAS